MRDLPAAPATRPVHRLRPVAWLLGAVAFVGACSLIPAPEEGEYGFDCSQILCSASAPVCVGLPTGNSVCLTREPGGEGEACVDSLECLPTAPACLSNVCSPLSDEGGACERSLDCLPTAPVCRGGRCGQLSREGAACGGDFECHPNAPFCTDGKCATCGADIDCGSDRAEGSFCTESADCAEGMHCTFNPAQPCVARCGTDLACLLATCDAATTTVCAPAGSAGPNEPCLTTGDCQADLVCEQVAFVRICVPPGAAAAGDSCQSTADCRAGLTCASGECSRAIVLPRLFAGGPCPEVTQDPPRFRFSLPTDDDEFFGLPFPNDIRLSPQGLDLRGFPAPALGEVGAELLEHYIDVIGRTARGFAPHSAAIFRYTGTLDFASVRDNLLSDAYFVDLTPGDDFGKKHGSVFFTATNGGGRFICPKWVGLRPQWGPGFRHGHTYAALITRVARTPEGAAFVQDDDFRTMLAAGEPSGEAAKAAWQAYQPLRDWLADPSVEVGADDLAVASVFTVGTPTARMPQVADAASSAPAAVDPDTDWFACSDGASSPCGECGPSADGYQEYHGRLSLPIYQEGTAPYLQVSDGGALRVVAGEVREVRREPVCAALTVPSGQAPDEGWPLVVYAHGTGGTFRAAVDQGFASDLASRTVAGASVRAATLGFTQVQHAERRGDSELPPEVLFFNFANLHAARGNFLQGAADLLSITAWAASGDPVDVAGEAVPFDPARVTVLAHSQGATAASLAGPFAPHIRAIVLSGGGGGLSLTLLNKSEPVDIAGAVQALLSDGTDGDGQPLKVTDYHPVLALAQLYFASVDPINYGRAFNRDAPEGAAAKSLLFTTGQGDAYTPNVTAAAWLRSADLPVVGSDILDFKRPEQSPPITANRRVGEADVTQISAQYRPDGYDGHFVIFRNERARKDVLDFLATALIDDTPTLRP